MKKGQTKEDDVVNQNVEAEAQHIVDSETISEKISETIKKSRLKSGLTREELFQKRVELFGKKKAMLGAFIYKIASIMKKEKPDIMAKISENMKDKSKNTPKQGMYLFDSFLKFSAVNGNITAGSFFKMDENSDAYKRIIKVAERARLEYTSGEIGKECKSLLWLCAAIYKQLQKKAGSRSSGVSSKQESKFIREIKEFSFLD